MRRAFFFIVAIVFATTSLASIPRVSALDPAPPIADSLYETRIRVSEVLAPFERPAESELTRALRQAYAGSSTTSASGLGRFLSVDPAMDLKKTIPNPQKWNRYSYVRNNPINAIDPDGRDDLFIGEDFRYPFPAARTRKQYISNEQASIGISFIPGYGDGYDAISAIRGRDLLTGERIGPFARIAGAVLPFVGVGLLNKATDIFRGGESLVAAAKDVKIKDGLVQTTHGLSVNTDASKMEKFGGAYRITSMPDGLKIIQRGTTDPNHYEIVPVKPIKMEDYQKLLSQVKLERVN